ncbi:MAG: M4 family metallopeptidase, partial [Alphaproteobacteria bacterium]
ASRADAVTRAFDGFGATRTFYREILNRDSIDDQGRRLDGYVHYGRADNHAFWNGREMVFGDGDGVLFTDFTKSLDVIAHELTHGVTEFAAGLEYHDQPGALNESMSDVFGSLVKQWSLKQSAEEADWLIGADVFTPDIRADALRSMKAPGTAYDNPDLGKDPQPDSMDKYAQLPNTDEGDNGGVHINSGIPNKAFYVTAREIGGFAWEAPGHIWYEALRASGPNTTFQEFADTTYQKAGQLYGAGSAQQKAVFEGWAEVKIKITGVDAAPPPAPGDKELITLLVKQVDDLSATVKQLAEELNRIKSA